MVAQVAQLVAQQSSKLLGAGSNPVMGDWFFFYKFCEYNSIIYKFFEFTFLK